MSNLFGVGRGQQIYKNVLAMGVKIGGGAVKIGKNSPLLVLMCMRLLQKTGLIDLTNQDRFKKVNGYKIRTKSVRNYW